MSLQAIDHARDGAHITHTSDLVFSASDGGILQIHVLRYGDEQRDSTGTADDRKFGSETDSIHQSNCNSEHEGSRKPL
jgi:hypothetical protein